MKMLFGTKICKWKTREAGASMTVANNKELIERYILEPTSCKSLPYGYYAIFIFSPQISFDHN